MEQATQYLECFFANQNDSFVRTTWTVTQCHGESLKVNGGPTVKHLIPPPYNKRQRQSTPCLSGHSLSAISQATLGLTDCTISFVTQHDYRPATHSFSDVGARRSCIWNVFQKVRERERMVIGDDVYRALCHSVANGDLTHGSTGHQHKRWLFEVFDPPHNLRVAPCRLHPTNSLIYTESRHGTTPAK